VTRTVEVVITHLAMTTPDALRPATRAPDGVRLSQATGADAATLARACYRLVGGPWHWTDRLQFDDAAWQEMLDEEHGEVWVARDSEGIAGYFQLAVHDAVVEIRYFGLVSRCIGQGIGGWMLTRAAERAWSLDPSRVVLNTCTLDGPAALPNYLKRGFTVVREEHRIREIA
jgi:GNAT superfamily N-acetyltransferase